MCDRKTYHSNSIRGPANAAFFDFLDAYVNRRMRSTKARLFEKLPKRVLEIGPGVGANFSFFQPGTHVIAVEPNVHMHKRLAKKATSCGLELSILPDGAESMDVPDHSLDAVICTLVLCTVADAAEVLSEVQRVLKPGGRFIFVEHVVAPKGSPRRVIQNILRAPWKYMFEGCCLDRDTETTIRGAGFKQVQIEQYRMQSLFTPVNYQIAGIAEC